MSELVKQEPMRWAGEISHLPSPGESTLKMTEVGDVVRAEPRAMLGVFVVPLAEPWKDPYSS